MAEEHKLGSKPVMESGPLSAGQAACLDVAPWLIKRKVATERWQNGTSVCQLLAVVSSVKFLVKLAQRHANRLQRRVRVLGSSNERNASNIGRSVCHLLQKIQY